MENFIENNGYNENIESELLIQMNNMSDDDKFIIIESPIKIIFYDPKKNEGLSLFGELEVFKDNISRDILNSIAAENNHYYNKNQTANEIELFDIPNATNSLRNYFVNEVTFQYISSNRDNILSTDEFSNRVKEEHFKKITFDKWENNDTLLPHDEYLKHKIDNKILSFCIQKDFSDNNYSLIIHDHSRSYTRNNGKIPYEEGGTLFYKGDINSSKDIVKKTIEYIDKTHDYSLDNINKFIKQNNINISLEIAKKTGHVQGVCECVAILGDNHDLAKKMLTEMKVTKDIAKKYANPETFKILEQGIFAQKQNQKLEQTQGVKR